MTEPTESREVTLDLTAAEFQLVLSGLKFLLAAESDAEEVDSLKRLIQRLEAR